MLWGQNVSLLHCCGALDFCNIGERNVLVVFSEGQRLALEFADTVIIWLLSSWYQSKPLPPPDSSVTIWLVKRSALTRWSSAQLNPELVLCVGVNHEGISCTVAQSCIEQNHFVSNTQSLSRHQTLYCSM